MTLLPGILGLDGLKGYGVGFGPGQSEKISDHSGDLEKIRRLALNPLAAG